MDKVQINKNKEMSKIPNYIIFIFLFMLLVLDFLPKRYNGEIATIQFLYLSVYNIFLGIYLYVNKRLIGYDIFFKLKENYVSRIYLIFLIICGLSFITAKNESLVIMRITQLIIIFVLFINLAILLNDKLGLFYRGVFIFSIGAFFQAGYALYGFVQYSSFISTDFALNHLTGNTENINIFAASLSIKVPFLLMGISYFTGLKKKFLVFTLFLATTAIFLTAARASMLSLMLTYLVYILYYLKINSFQKVFFARCMVFIVPVLLAMFVSNKTFRKVQNNDHRYISIATRIEQINVNESSSRARLVYWENAIKMGLKNPILGLGLGNYCIESIPYESTFEDGFNASLYPHNDFLQIFAETGIFNALFYISIFVFVFVINMRKILKFNNSNAEKIAILTLLIILVYAVDAFFNFPMYMPSMEMFFVLALVLTVINIESSIVRNYSKSRSTNLLVFFILLSVTVGYSSVIIYKARILQDEIVRDDINQKTKGILSGDEVVARIPAYPNVFSTSESFYEYAAIYYIREENYQKALLCFEKADKINPYSGRINFYRHYIWKQKGMLDSAYIYMKRSFYQRPRNLLFFQNSTVLAAIKKDTLEIFKEHETFLKQRKIPDAWIIPANELRKINFNKKSLLNFINVGLKQVPNDSTLLKLRKELSFEDYASEGQRFIAQSKFDKARESFEEILRNNPKDIKANQIVGFLYFNEKKNEKAIVHFLNVLKYSDQNNGTIEYYIGLCYLRLDDKENACKYFNLAKARKFISAQKMIAETCL